MVENIIVIFIVAGVAILILRKLYLIFSGKNVACACGANGCLKNDGCASRSENTCKCSGEQPTQAGIDRLPSSDHEGEKFS